MNFLSILISQVIYNVIISYQKKQDIDQKHFFLLCVKCLEKILFLYITLKLGFDIDRKSAKL